MTPIRFLTVLRLHCSFTLVCSLGMRSWLVFSLFFWKYYYFSDFQISHKSRKSVFSETNKKCMIKNACPNDVWMWESCRYLKKRYLMGSKNAFLETFRENDHIANFYRVVRSLLHFNLAAKTHIHTLTSPSTKNAKTWSTNARNYNKITYQLELWRWTCANSSKVFWIPIFGANSSFTTKLISWPGNKNSPYGNLFLLCV